MRAAALVTGAAAAMAAVLAASGTAAAGGPRPGVLVEGGRFAPLAEGAPVPGAVTYDTELVPPGARAVVAQRVAGDGRMSVVLAVRGLVPGHTYGSHVHTDPCGADPADAGPHYQDVAGEATPRNEIWLDVTADEHGRGWAAVTQDWVFRPGEAGALVLHEHATSDGHHGTTPGDAGDRAACLTVPFLGGPAAG
ncbi:superoxide dismutase family protein [Streptomyces sp. DSM 44917]|uniref:Superoxide dismutase family protein n=1 Tax=Streptomyces boetiae TaxID=3075541 RepID=A0ABU2L426_9ACTN|nr:superoxide dismutase family protein [Streptomyces sp. DSM 44917]MDT0306073.1 superoxide dismutase family protein [Streptomyces sp. DSM 44917]